MGKGVVVEGKGNYFKRYFSFFYTLERDWKTIIKITNRRLRNLSILLKEWVVWRGERSGLKNKNADQFYFWEGTRSDRQ